jgi:hypothetical protein
VPGIEGWFMGISQAVEEIKASVDAGALSV